MIPSVARMEQARAACTEALKTDELAAAIEFLAGRGFSADRCLDLLRTTAEVQVAVADLVELKRSALASSGPVAQPGGIGALAADPRSSASGRQDPGSPRR